MSTGGVIIRSRPAGPGRPPGPEARGFAGNLREFAGDQLGSLTRWAREHGDIVSARFGPKRIIFINHPGLVEEVLVHQNRKFIKHYRLRQAKLTLGEGLLTSEGEFWRAQRKLMQPAFHRERIAALGDLMVDFAGRLIASWEDGETRQKRSKLKVVAESVQFVGGGSKDDAPSEEAPADVPAPEPAPASEEAPVALPPSLPPEVRRASEKRRR